MTFLVGKIDVHGRTGRKKLRGAETNLPDFLGVQKIRQRTILGVQKFFRTYQNFSKHTNFPDITIFPTKLTQFPRKLTAFVPFFLIISQYCPTVERILPDWLCLPNKLGGLAPPPPRPVRPCRCVMLPLYIAQ
jgi:hypothetical protein